MEHDLVIRNGLVATPAGAVPTSIGVSGGRIVALGDRLAGARTIDAQGLWVLPGVIDGHTHVDAPAFGIRTRDSFASGTAAAAAGGVTTIVDFTLGDDRTTLAEQVEARIAAARDLCVDLALHAEVVGWRPDRADEIGGAVRLGATSFKFYTVYAERSDDGQLADAFRAIAAVDGVAMVHAEDAEIVRAATDGLSAAERRSPAALPRSRPPLAESAAVELVCHLAQATGVRLHVAHVSTAAACDVVRRAKDRGVRVTAETCPHYLLLDEAAYEQENGRTYTVIPPLRTAADRAALSSALRDGTIDAVATDHCTFMTRDKDRGEDVLAVPCGLPGVETLLPLVHSLEENEPEQLARWLCENPARIFGLAPRKGCIAVGADADLVLFDPDRRWTISAASLHMASDASPYEGRSVRGAVVRTLVRGRTVWADGELVTPPGWGTYVTGRTGSDDAV